MLRHLLVGNAKLLTLLDVSHKRSVPNNGVSVKDVQVKLKQCKMMLSDIYDEEFQRMLKLAKVLVGQVKKKKDREICKKWISRLCNLESYDPIVKKNRNDFFQYMLNVLRRMLDERPPGGMPRYDDKDRGKLDMGPKGFMSRWSHDRRTYVAAKPLPGKGALIYMAVAKDLTLGWEQPRSC